MGGMNLIWLAETEDGQRGLVETEVNLFLDREIQGKRGWWKFKSPITLRSDVDLKRYLIKFNEEEGFLMVMENLESGHLRPLQESEDMEEIIKDAISKQHEKTQFYKNAVKILSSKNADNYRELTEFVAAIPQQMDVLVRMLVSSIQNQWLLFLKHLDIKIKETDVKSFMQQVERDAIQNIQLNMPNIQYQTFSPPTRQQIPAHSPPTETPFFPTSPSPQPQNSENIARSSISSSNNMGGSTPSSDSAIVEAQRTDMKDDNDLAELLNALENGDVEVIDAGTSRKK